MKTKKFARKLSLNKSIIAHLNAREMTRTPGGAPPALTATIDNCCVLETLNHPTCPTYEPTDGWCITETC